MDIRRRLNEGYSYEMEFDGENGLERVVVVMLDIDSTCSIPCSSRPTAEAPEARTTFGFRSKAAIEWVKRNIENFGGDPSNITIAGQSAGGVSVLTHLCAKSTKGLFQKAIVQSSAGGSVPSIYPKSTFGRPITLEEAEQLGIDFLENHLGVKTIEEARQLDPFYIRDKYLEMGRRLPRSVIDGKYVDKDIAGYLFANEATM